MAVLAAVLLLTVAARATRTKLLIAVLLGGGVVGLRSITSPSFFSIPDRLEFYKYSIDFFLEYINLLSGAGIGSFQIFGVAIQRTNGLSLDQLWMSMHSDWLQLIFELGFLGSALVLYVYLDSLYRSDTPTKIALVGAGVFALFYFPLQIPVVLFLLFFLIAPAQLRARSL